VFYIHVCRALLSWVLVGYMCRAIPAQFPARSLQHFSAKRWLPDSLPDQKVYSDGFHEQGQVLMHLC
jgi:hypothetical protein